MNKCFFIGNLTRDPEVTYTAGGTAICKFSIAVNEKFKKEDEVVEKVHFLDIEAWGKQAEAIGQYFEKGKPIRVECKVKHDTWEDKETGNKRSKLLFTLIEFAFLPGGKKREDEDGGGAPEETAAPNKKKAAAKKKNTTSTKPAEDEGDNYPGVSGGDDEVPF